jgi:radical SAM modification target selenobiotic family peptide
MSMERADLKKVMAGFGLATLLAGVTLAGCASSPSS